MNTLRTGQAEVRGSNESGQLDSSGESSEGEETDDDSWGGGGPSKKYSDEGGGGGMRKKSEIGWGVKQFSNYTPPNPTSPPPPTP